MFIRELKQSISSLKGAGPRVQETLAQMGILSVGDMLLFPPRQYEDRTQPVPLSEFAQHAKVCTEVTVLSHSWFGYGRMKTLKVRVRDETAEAELVCFNRPFLEKQLVPGNRYFLTGAFQYRYGELQSSAFEIEELAEGADAAAKRKVLPIYPLSQALTQGVMRKLASRAYTEYGRYVENDLPASVLSKQGLVSQAEALRTIHLPNNAAEPEAGRVALAFSELFYLELIIGRRSAKRKETTAVRAQASSPLGLLKKRLLERLPFELTPDQASALAEIEADMESPHPMARLLQGDVGSGKTLVAFFACLKAIEAGGQALIIAPTELLARQHADNAARLLEPLGVRLAFLSGNVKESGRKPLLAALAAGEIDLVLGTHALFSDGVVYKNLRLVVIDEQHRFGVMQRLALSAKANEPDVLMMTATPIPRTLALTDFGDLDISTIRTMPQGRLPIKTHLAVHENAGKVYDFVRKELAAGHQAYFVYPLIEASEKLALKDAQTMYEHLSKEVFPGCSIRLIHSKVTEEEKREAMLSFTKGQTQILVATSVVEVGVDVPNATCIVIEQAERFGLAALHQLRGRVGRGNDQSYAFLVYSKDLTSVAKDRLKVMLESTDGFKISEEDLRIRGPGEITGTMQSGQLKFNFADLSRDFELLERSRAAAFSVLLDDPGFLKPEHAVIREVFNRAPPFSESIAARG
jgi:ATP-dependent DNA helicase RecG